MTLRKHANNYSSELDGSIDDSQTTIDVLSATGLPSIGASEVYNLTIDDGAGNIEIVTVTDDASSPTLTVTRGAEGTTPAAFASGVTVELRPTADSLDRKLDSVSGTSNTITVSSTDANNKVITIADNPIIPGTSGMVVPKGSSAGEGGAGTSGKLRHNTSTGYLRLDNGSSWDTVVVNNTGSSTSSGIPVWSGTNNFKLTSTTATIDTNNNLVANNVRPGYTTTATAAGTTTLTAASSGNQYFTGSTTQNCRLPVTSTLTLGHTYRIVNNSSDVVTVQSSGTDTVKAMAAGTELIVTCIATTGTDETSWDAKSNDAGSGGSGSPGGSDTQVQYNNSGSFGGITGATTNGTALTLTAPVLGTPASGTLTNCTGLPRTTGLAADTTFFRAYAGSVQSVATATYTKVQLNTEVIDLSGTFDNVTNYRHTPTVAGNYLYFSSVAVNTASDQNQITNAFYKNGSLISQNPVRIAAAYSPYISYSAIIPMNGTTDYVELYVRHVEGSNLDTLNTADACWLSGVLL